MEQLERNYGPGSLLKSTVDDPSVCVSNGLEVEKLARLGKHKQLNQMESCDQMHDDDGCSGYFVDDTTGVTLPT